MQPSEQQGASQDGAEQGVDAKLKDLQDQIDKLRAALDYMHNVNGIPLPIEY